METINFKILRYCSIFIQSKMVVDPRDIKLPGYTAVVLSLIAIILACIAVGTPSWQILYSDAPNNTVALTTTSYYYMCYAINATCTNYGYSSESYLHLRQASGLAIVGILFVAFGAIATYILVIHSFDDSSNIKDNRHRDLEIFSGPFLLFIGTITMLAALAEGSRSILYNGYSANLYQTAHVISIFALLASAYVSGRRTLMVDQSAKPLLLQ